MRKSALNEILKVKEILSHIVGTTDLPAPQKFNKAALDKAAKWFAKMVQVEKQWVKGYEVSKYFKDCYSNETGKFIREEFGFSNYYNKGGATFYNKKDLIKLSEELKARNVNLLKYMELKKGQAHIEKKLMDVAIKNRDERIKRKRKKNYTIPDELKNITLSDYKLPDRNVVERDIENLMIEFKNGNYEQYIYNCADSACIKYDDTIRNYLKGVNGTLYRKWCSNFNKAKHALKLIDEYQPDNIK